MKNIIKFLLFIAYSTSIFFLPNNYFILFPIIINLLAMFLSKKQLKRTIAKTLKILPFIIFTFIVNYILDNFTNAIWIAIKLIIVCNITIIYSETTSITRDSRNNKIIVHSIKGI